MSDYICKGFTAAGVTSGLKKNGGKDLGLIFSEVDANVAGVFTRNLVRAAPVLLDKERVESGACRAVIANSGNANCCNGAGGMRDAVAMSEFAAKGLGVDSASVLVASTGVIGNSLPIKKIESASPSLVKALDSNGFSDFAEAIMTTDTVPKIVSCNGRLCEKDFTVLGIAKGSGMIHPDMATMLCFIRTDIGADSGVLQSALYQATDLSFNSITIDGDTSTNDTVLLMANGLSGAYINTKKHKEIFQDILNDVMVQLSEMIVKDGEGATKFVEVIVEGAGSDLDARDIAETVAGSNLVKTALFGEDANWGRILAAVGRAGVPINPDGVNIYFDEVMMVRDGVGCGEEAEARASRVLKLPEFTITIDLNIGNGHASMSTCDFSMDYVKINADYRS